MKGALGKELKSTIKYNLSRFISIIIIIFLGVSFFIGMTTNSSVLENTMNNYLEENNYWDIKVYSYIGLTKNDVAAIKKEVNDIEEIEPKYYVEALTKIRNTNENETNYPIFVHSYNDDYKINKLKILEGNSITKDDECLINAGLAQAGKKIGDTIEFSNSYLLRKSYTIVGIVEDPQYISLDKGVSTLQGNMVKYTAYISESDFKSDNDIFYSFDIRLKNKYDRTSPKYDKYLENVKTQIKTESDGLLSIQIDKYIAEKTAELEAAEQEYNQKKQEAESQLQGAENAINEKERQINSLKTFTLPGNKASIYVETLRKNLEASKKSLDTAEKAINVANKLTTVISVANATFNPESDIDCTPSPGYTFEARRAMIYGDSSYTMYDEENGTSYSVPLTEQDYEGYWQGDLSEEEKEVCWRNERIIVVVEEQLDPVLQASEMLNEYESMLGEMYEQYDMLDCSDIIGTPGLAEICNNTKNSLAEKIQTQEESIQELTDEINYIQDALENTRSISELIDVIDHYVEKATIRLNKSKVLYEDALEEYNIAAALLNKSSGSISQDLSDAESQIAAARNELAAKKKEISDQLEAPYNEIIEGKNLLKNIKKNPWVINTRNDSYGYGNYQDDIKRLENISKVLPMIFFIVASLVTATSITRLVEEERHKIGILKSLGCNKEQIIMKYISYAFVATIVGVIFGVMVGTFCFPILTSKVYSSLYYIPKIIYSIHIKQIIIVLIISLLSTVAVAYFAANKVTSEEPAALLKYKPIKTTPLINIDGNKGILKYLSNIRKLVYRNITTSPIRSIMTIAGILGCTTLVVASFSVRQSVQTFIDIQFDKIYKADAEFYYKSDLMQSDIEEDYIEVSKMDDVKNASVGRKEMLRMKDDQTIEIYGITPASIEKFEMNTNLYSTVTKDKISLKNKSGIIITEKAARQLNVHKGDLITFIDSSNIEHTVKVDDICENYLYNYIFMNKETYARVYDYEVQYNFMSVQYKEDVDIELLNSDIYNREQYSNFLSINYYYKQHKNISKTLNIIITIVIISAALLAFVVIYNISKINIDEKTVEIATLKVLGYRNKWIGNYLKTEIRVLEFIGILLGLIGGYYLGDTVITACETNYLMFVHGIMFRSWIYGILVTAFFMLIMNLVIYINLKKVNMSQALKSPEE